MPLLFKKDKGGGVDVADITNKNELKRRIKLFFDELDYSINEDFRRNIKFIKKILGIKSPSKGEIK